MRDGVVMATAGVAHLALLILLWRERVDWDGVSFLLQVHDYGYRDFAHWLYAPLLRAASWATSPLGLDLLDTARLVSSLGSTVAFLALWRLLARAGHAPSVAGPAAALFTTAPAFWSQAVGVEVYAPSLGALMLAALAASRRRASPSAFHATAAFVFWMAASALHIGALLALPWLIVLAGPRGLGRRDLVGPGAAALLVLAVFAYLRIHPRELLGFAEYASGFMRLRHSPDPADEVVAQSLHFMRRFFLEEAPVITVTGAVGALLTILRPRRLAAPVVLALPYLVAYAAMGSVMLGLLLPVLPALACTAAAGFPITRRLAGPLLGVALLLQVSFELPTRYEEATSPDPQRVAAELIAARVPPQAVVFSGHAAKHLEFHTDVEVILLPERLHLMRTEGKSPAEMLAWVHDEARRLARAGRAPVMDVGGAEILKVYGITRAQVQTLLNGAGLVTLQEEPRVGLFPFRP